ncbi:MAG: hypothetical protein Q9M97_08350 [Candidatus Gracilibacteria bacterium]|nr:hypothetical protein [Candidatus Gracilibacteria bacterium]
MTTRSERFYADNNGNGVKDDEELYSEITGNFNNFENYHTSSEIKTLVQNNRNLEGIKPEVKEQYYEFWNNLLEQYDNGEIAYAEIEEKYKEFWDYENGGIKEINDIDSQIFENDAVIESNDDRELTQYSRDILDSFKKQKEIE